MRKRGKKIRLVSGRVELLSSNPHLRRAYSLAVKSFDARRSQAERSELRQEAMAILDKLVIE